MSTNFTPGVNAEPNAPWSTALLAQRDVSQQIPINFVTNPAISLTAACFGEGRYEDDTAAVCISNLLAIGYRRLLLDVYWDAPRHVWSLCPVQVPDSSSGNTPLPSAPTIFSSSDSIFSVHLSNSPRAVQVDALAAASLVTTDLMIRQMTPTPSSSGSLSASFGMAFSSRPMESTSSSKVATATSSIAPSASVINSPSGPLYELGPYSCTSSVQLPLLAKIVGQYLAGSQTTLGAFMQYLEINLHAAASLDDPIGPALAVNASDLPTPGNFVSNVLAESLASYLYTPSILSSDRGNLNASWYSVQEEDHYPDSYYFTSEEGLGGIHTSPNGWPCEAYVEMDRLHRLLISFGSIDPEMSGYNPDVDSASIFAPDYLQQNRTTSFSSTGQITSGCFFNPNTHNLSQLNNSWAFSDNINLPADNPSALTTANISISNLTSCGISPLLTDPILNSTASTASNTTSLPSYASLAYSTIWSWAPLEPANSSLSSPYYAPLSTQPSPTQFRCAAFNALSTPPGRWHVADCTSRHYAACRSLSNPYEWSISAYRGAYTQVDDNCASGSAFAVPRTALENAYLLSTLRATRPDILAPADPSVGDPDGDSSEDAAAGVIWINFNSLGTQGCWVAGVSRTCPYVGLDDAEHRRQVLVPTVAAVIVLFLGLLTVFVKCAANRQSSRRRRRRKREGGWDYEGVPS